MKKFLLCVLACLGAHVLAMEPGAAGPAQPVDAVAPQHVTTVTDTDRYTAIGKILNGDYGRAWIMSTECDGPVAISAKRLGQAVPLTRIQKTGRGQFCALSYECGTEWQTRLLTIRDATSFFDRLRHCSVNDRMEIVFNIEAAGPAHKGRCVYVANNGNMLLENVDFLDPFKRGPATHISIVSRAGSEIASLLLLNRQSNEADRSTGDGIRRGTCHSVILVSHPGEFRTLDVSGDASYTWGVVDDQLQLLLNWDGKGVFRLALDITTGLPTPSVNF